MDSTVPMRSPSVSTMVAPCQLRTVSRSGMVHPLLVVWVLLLVVGLGWPGERDGAPGAPPAILCQSRALSGHTGLSGAAVGGIAPSGNGPVGRPQGDGQTSEGADQVQAVVGAVEGQEVDVAVAGGEQPVQEGKAVAGRQQPAIGPGGVQPPPQREPGQPDGEVDEVVDRVDLEAEQGL